ncbi:Hypothetical predicted protein [Pelobates cultripes]|uniref:Uncharacterized protein n=1 Tax=Pelobates cultripes TaxID=61616 RepID=A0AAD1SYC1_PELCU|nr:Hypothetical predicted protein [Pelobates cultripes]
MHLIEEYGGLSYYSLNTSKTQALGLRLDPPTLTQLRNTYQFEWRTNDIKYLGLTFTKKVSDMFPTNYTKVWNECLTLLRGWEKLFLTWTERIVAIKMSVLPKLQYVFRNLPLKVPQSYFKTIHSKLLQFTWGAKRARISCKLLSAPVKHGGMALPNVKAYYQAAALTPLLTHLVKNNQPQWVHLENLAVKPFAIHILTWLHKPNRPTIPLLPLQIQLALQIWDTHRRKFETANPLSMATPIEAITYCIPTFHAMPWKDKGISHLAQVFESGKLMGFDRLNTIFNLPHTSSYSYIQLKSFLHTRNKDSRNETMIASALSIWEQTGITGKLPQTFKPLSGCYRLILPYQSLSDSTPAHQWEIDLQTPITEKQWSSITSSTRKLIKSAPLIEQHQKTIYRWYMVPLRIHKLYPTASPTCWRCKQEKGSVLHIWWKCPRLIRYWEDIRKIIADTTTIHLPFDPKTFLLLDISREIPTQTRKLMYHVLLTAQKLIARLWKTTDTPSIPALIQDIDKQAIYETSFSKAQNSTKGSGSTWEQWRAWRNANAQHVLTNHNLN